MQEVIDARIGMGTGRNQRNAGLSRKDLEQLHAQTEVLLREHVEKRPEQIRAYQRREALLANVEFDADLLEGSFLLPIFVCFANRCCHFEVATSWLPLLKRTCLSIAAATELSPRMHFAIISNN